MPRLWKGNDMSDTKEILRIITDRICAVAGARLAFGDPVHAEGRTVIPVARARFGFGVGGGRSKKAGGGGGGAVVTPAGIVEITADSAEFIRFARWKPVVLAAAAGFAAGFAVNQYLSRRAR